MMSTSNLERNEVNDAFLSVGWRRDTIRAELSRLKAANKVDGVRGRSLALGITNIEQGLFWLDDAVETIARNNGIAIENEEG